MCHLNLRIAEALALSALVHAGIYVWIFAPLQPLNGAGPVPSAVGALTVTIDRGPEQSAMLGARVPPGAAAVPAQGGTPPLSPEHLAQAAARAARGKTRNPMHEPKDPTRPALPDELTVNVLLLEGGGPDKPQDYVEAGGQRYAYFNSPGLKEHVRPLVALRPRYPAMTPEDPDGAVVLQLLISEHGALEQVSVVCAAAAFENSARASIAGMRFSPARGQQGPVKSYMLVEFAYGRGFPCARLPD